MPPFLMAAIRFLIAGAILYVIELKRGSPRPTIPQWRSALIIGGFLLLVGNGGVSWAEQVMPSGVTALLISTTPFWFVVIDWLWYRADRPNSSVVVGLVVGLAGVLLLIGPDRILTGGGFPISGIVVLLIATVSWCAGSLYSRRAVLPSSPFMATAMEMLGGGALLLVASTVAGEPFTFDPATVTMKSLFAVGYLIVFGSLIGFTAYIWLLGVTTPARVSTYAYVNPVIAVFLGWTLGGEEMTARIAIAALVIVAGVAVIVLNRR